jgi:hypothetical protein
MGTYVKQLGRVYRLHMKGSAFQIWNPANNRRERCPTARHLYLTDRLHQVYACESLIMPGFHYDT